MKNKKWLIAIAIISVLIFAFFWGGNQHTSTIKFDESTTNQSLNDIGSAISANEQQEKEHNERSATEANRPDVGITVPETKVLPSNNTEKKNPSNEKKKRPEERKDPQKEPPQKDTNQSVTKLDPGESNPEETPSGAVDKKDKYLTDPIPEGKPKPVEWQDAAIDKNKQLTCTLSVTCKTILDNMGKFNKDKLEVLPDDGIIYKTQTVNFSEGESVFDVLLREMKKNKIHMEFEMTPIYNSNYIEGIHNLYEFDCGELSGWMYKVNGWFPNYGCSRYELKDGDIVEWIYTCDLGRDIGGGMAVGGKEP